MPAVDPLSETLISLADAAKLIPARRAGKTTDLSTIYRWTNQGVRGIRLEFWQIGATRCTTRQALTRFFQALTAAVQGEDQSPRVAAARKARGAKAEAPREQGTIFCLIELAQAPVSLRELCRRLDATGRRRRDGKKWADKGHGLVRSILRREGILAPADATAAVQRRIEEIKRRAEDKYRPETLSDAEARAQARGGR